LPAWNVPFALCEEFSILADHEVEHDHARDAGVAGQFRPDGVDAIDEVFVRLSEVHVDDGGAYLLAGLGLRVGNPIATAGMDARERLELTAPQHVEVKELMARR
jgi:hypothetical protein